MVGDVDVELAHIHHKRAVDNVNTVRGQGWSFEIGQIGPGGAKAGTQCCHQENCKQTQADAANNRHAIKSF